MTNDQSNEERREAAIEAADAEPWYGTYENIVRLVQHMADTHVDVQVIAHFVEKPHNYTAEYVEMLEIEAAEEAEYDEDNARRLARRRDFHIARLLPQPGDEEMTEPWTVRKDEYVEDDPGDPEYFVYVDEDVKRGER